MTVFLGAERVSAAEKPAAKASEPTRAELVAKAEALGLAVPSKAPKAEILAALASARGEAE